MAFVWYLRIMAVVWIIGTAVGIFRDRGYVLDSVELLDQLYMAGNPFPSFGDATPQMDLTSGGELTTLVVRIWNLIIRTIPAVVLLALAEGLSAIFYIRRRLQARTRQPVPPPNVPSYAARPKSSVPEDWR